MRIDRRQFIQAGAVALIAGSACGPNDDSSRKPPAGTGGAAGGTGTAAGAKPPTSAAGARLSVTIQGLYVVERKGSQAVVHLIDATKVGMPTHRAELTVLASLLDQAKTSAPTRKDPAGSDQNWVWDLTGVNVTMPPSPNGGNDLSEDQPSSEDSLDIPITDAGWQSPARMLDLKTVCGASHITRYDAMTSSISLTHGHLGVGVPTGYGKSTVWAFADPSGKMLLNRAISDLGTYTCPIGAQPLVVQIGSAKLVILANKVVEMTIQNLPIGPLPVCPAPCQPNMAHFAALSGVVDKQFDPTITVTKFDPLKMADAGAGYCPGGSV
jgi:hypothetical protein